MHFDGHSMLGVAAHRRGAVLMFQKAYLFPFLSVAENIAFGLKIQGASRATQQAEVRCLLDLVELPGIERKRPAQLSGGEQQRVALARALVTHPRVLLLDEPFSSLDPAVRQTLQEAVRRIQGELGITTLLVTHDRGEALAMADQVALLDRGELLACEPMLIPGVANRLIATLGRFFPAFTEELMTARSFKSYQTRSLHE
ncbi:MAG: ABC transporter ATP-binding protein [Oscillochloridaceae bacterium umkhey_bin13]